MIAASEGLDKVVAQLIAEPVPTAEVRTRAPATAGLYAWWAPPTVLSALVGPPHPARADLRLLYVGIATRLRSRLASRDVEEAIIRMLLPPLTVDHGAGPAVDLVRAARRRYYDSAGVRPSSSEKG